MSYLDLFLAWIKQPQTKAMILGVATAMLGAAITAKVAIPWYVGGLYAALGVALGGHSTVQVVQAKLAAHRKLMKQRCRKHL